jgi:tRNA(Ile)-lysidine synthase
MASFADAWPGAVAVSGGGDSVALMLLFANWAKASKRAKPIVLTVDHGLRGDSAADAQKVVLWAKAADLPVQVLRWKAAKPNSDIEAAARDARYRLMGKWCRKHRIAQLYVGHTLEDQAETFLLRLGRGSGLDGLSAMRATAHLPVAGLEEITLVRPLLEFHREQLRDYLRARSQNWLEDSMNNDPRFARSRVRALLPVLEGAGIPAQRIAAAAHHLSRARTALEHETASFLASYCRFTENGVLFDGEALGKLPSELGLRALARMLTKVSGESYRPRFERLQRLFQVLVDGKLGRGTTLHGCKIAPAPRRFAAFGAGSLVVVKEKGRRGTKRRARS